MLLGEVGTILPHTEDDGQSQKPANALVLKPKDGKANLL